MNRRNFFSVVAGALASVALPWRNRAEASFDGTYELPHPTVKLAKNVSASVVADEVWVLRSWHVTDQTGMDDRTVTIVCDYKKTPGLLNAIKLRPYKGDPFKQLGF